MSSSIIGLSPFRVTFCAHQFPALPLSATRLEHQRNRLVRYPHRLQSVRHSTSETSLHSSQSRIEREFYLVRFALSRELSHPECHCWIHGKW